ncbi:MAG: DUF11 domain-containing protein [Verrucomicrobiota bacterium]
MLALLALMAVVTRVEAQSFEYFYSLSGSPDPVLLNSNLTYTINLTNLAGLSGGYPIVIVTNTLDVQSTFVSATNTYVYPGVSTTNNGNVVIFNLGQFGIGGNEVAQMTVIAQPTAVGLITNTVTFNVVGQTNFTTNIVIQVTSVPATLADLAVAMTGPPSAVFTNDWMTYGVSVTNLGPSAASNVMLTNTLPTGVGYKSVSPTITRLGSGSNVIFNLGTLASGAFTNLLLTVQPTNAGVLPFSSFVNSTSVTDPNPANNTASTNITVTNYFPANLGAFTNSGQIIDFLNALTEQSITVSNAGPSPVAAVRVVVTGLTNQLFNAVGTNNGNPFVVYNAALNTNQSVNLLLQFYPRSYFPFTNGQLHAFAVTNLNLAPPTAAVGTNVNITRILKLTTGSPLIIGSMLIEWPSTPGQIYTVVYSDNVLFSNAMIALPSVVAPANQTPWIDYGPPTTVSAPPNSTNRFYRVFLNP